MKKIHKCLISAPFYFDQYPLLGNWKKYIEAERDYSKQDVMGFLVINNIPEKELDRVMRIAEPKFIEIVNIGFGKRDDVLFKARNLALQKVIKEKFDFLYFFDVDVLSKETILKDMIKYMKDKVACVSAKVPLRGRTKEPLYIQTDPNLLQFQNLNILNKPLPPIPKAILPSSNLAKRVILNEIPTKRPLPPPPKQTITAGKKYISGRLEKSNFAGQMQAKNPEINYIEMNALGFGACLIKREAIVKFPQIPPPEKWHLGSEDFTYTDFLFKAGYRLLLIKDMRCYHGQIDPIMKEIRFI